MGLNIKATQTGQIKAPRLIFYGDTGAGKSTIGMGAPRAAWFSCEEGHRRVVSSEPVQVIHFDEDRVIPNSYDEFVAKLQEIARNPPDLDWIGVDGFSFVETLATRAVCEKGKVDALGKVGGGWGKGERELFTRMNDLLWHFQEINKRGIGIILICHAESSKVPSEGGQDNGTRWSLKLQSAPTGANVDGLYRSWADAVIYVKPDVERAFNAETKKSFNVLVNDRRLMCTRVVEGSYVFQAKCWSHVDDTIESDIEAGKAWHKFWSQVTRPATPEAIEADVKRLLAIVPPEDREQAEKKIATSPAWHTIEGKRKLRHWLQQKVEKDS